MSYTVPSDHIAITKGDKTTTECNVTARLGATAAAHMSRWVQYDHAPSQRGGFE
jgi:hypothetical protein